jgi:hypothetical protein
VKGGKQMIIKVYDYGDGAKEITLPDKEISLICITILSGDETGFVRFSDGETIWFDAIAGRGMRLHTFYDGQYIVDGEDIQKWIDFKPTGRIPTALERVQFVNNESDE